MGFLFHFIGSFFSGEAVLDLLLLTNTKESEEKYNVLFESVVDRGKFISGIFFF